MRVDLLFLVMGIGFFVLASISLFLKDVLAFYGNLNVAMVLIVGATIHAALRK